MAKNRLNDVVSIKVTPALRTEVEQVARRRETSMSEVVRDFIIECLRRVGITA